MVTRFTEQNTILEIRDAIKAHGMNPTRSLQHLIIQNVLNGNFVCLNENNLIVIDSVGH